jgi:hypothetical protein
MGPTPPPDRPGDQEPSDRERRVLEALDEALEVEEPLPEHLVRQAEASYTWRTFDAELLELLVDSASDELAVVREQQLQRFMVFGAGERGVHFECSWIPGRGFELAGFVVPAGAYQVRAEQPPDELVVETDGSGQFRLAAARAETTRLTIRAQSGPELMVTPWFVLRDPSDG